MTITLAAVYAPIGFQGGLTGALFREFAFTLAGAVFISGVVALTLSPMMSSRLLRAEHAATAGSARTIDRAFERLKRALRARARRHARASRPAVYAVWIVLVAADRPDVHVLAEGARAERGPGRRLRRPRRAGQRHASSRSRPYTEQVNDDLREHARVRAQLPDHASRPAASAACCSSRGSERERSIFPIQAELNAQAASASPASARRCSCRRRCPSAGLLPGRVRDRLDRRATRSSSRFADAAGAGGGRRAASSRSRRSSTCGSIRRRPRS